MRFPVDHMGRIFVLCMLFAGQGLWAQSFEGLGEAIRQGNRGSLKAVVISQHGEIIYEDYFRGTQRTDLQPVFSVTKSVGSALIGIAHRQGKIRLDQSLGEFFSELYPMALGVYRDKQFISVEAVLQQRHGIEWDEWTMSYSSQQNPIHQAIASDDWYRYTLTRPTDASPGDKFTYNTMASTLMSRMIRQVAGQSPRNFALTELFAPLGITNVHWELYNNQGIGHGLTDFPNPDGDEPLGLGLWLRPIDMIKLGELYLNRGVIGQRRILDRSWIDASWAAYSHSGNTEYFSGSPGSGYGYQWWVQRITDDRARTWSQFYAVGWARQYILVYPELDLVVVSLADDFNYSGPGIGSLLRTFILPRINPRLDERFTGSWYDPNTDGQGISLEILAGGNRLVGYWYTYGEGGNKRWFTLDGPISESEANVVILETHGGNFLQNDPVTLSEWGTGQFRVVDCNHMTLEINSPQVSTSIPLTRLTGSCNRDQPGPD